MNTLPIYNLNTYNSINEFINCDSNNLFINLPYENKPLFTLGYHYFIQRTREAMNIIDKLETKNEFYYVVNPFEINIQNYEDTIINLSKIYLNESPDTSDFYQIWEICFIFDILTKENIEFLILKDNNINIIKAITLFRQKFYETINKKDKNLKYKKDINVDLIISDYFAKTENIFLDILIEQIIIIIETQKQNGNLILKVYDTFTLPTIKLLYLITSLYEESYIYKPLFSRPSDTDKFIICKNFKCNDQQQLIKNLTKIKKEKTNYIIDIFLDFDIPKKFLHIFKFTNIKFVNINQIMINKIVKYIKDNNYFGDKYHDYRKIQIQSTEWWVSIFFPPSHNIYIENKDLILKLFRSSIEKNNIEEDKLFSQLI